MSTAPTIPDLYASVTVAVPIDRAFRAHLQRHPEAYAPLDS